MVSELQKLTLGEIAERIAVKYLLASEYNASEEIS